jgi:hypothetical protein
MFENVIFLSVIARISLGNFILVNLEIEGNLFLDTVIFLDKLF